MNSIVRISKKFTLQYGDYLRSAGIAALTAIIVGIQQAIESGSMDFNWKTIGMSGIGAGIGYLLKNGLLEPPKVITTLESNIHAEIAKETIKEAV